MSENGYVKCNEGDAVRDTVRTMAKGSEMTKDEHILILTPR